ncbi:hypothetical protein UF75_0044 [Desulfosporosinus sp. I2]|nr:hypothetical protein UF75_0044 [Desulfosporosinus sp. I2]
MPPKWNKITKPVTNHTSTHTEKVSPSSNTTSKERDTIIPTKEKSPDDLEIFD